MKRLLAATLLLLAAAVTAVAQVPTLMSYQGHVTDASGVALGNTTPTNYTVLFKFYSVSTGGTPLYAESQVVTISGGEFSVLLGNGTGISGLKGRAAPALTPYVELHTIITGNIYLGVTVGSGAEITPRQQIVSGAYAFRAKYAEGLIDNSLTAAMLTTSAVTTTKILDANITTSKIADANITTGKIADANITTGKIADANITTGKIADSAVNSAKILDGTIATVDIADSQITGAKIVDGTIASVDIGDGVIGSWDIGDGQIATADIAGNAVDFARLAAAVQQALCPTGSILPFAGDTAPTGWLLCDGTALNRNGYATLFAVVGTRFGYGDSTNFRVPDLRGRFLRGRDGGAGRDEDRNSRGAMNSGGSTGDAVGSVQDEQYRSHTHNYYDIYFSENGGSGTAYTNGWGSGDSDGDNEPSEILRTGIASGGNETRPDNANVNYIIKY